MSREKYKKNVTIVEENKIKLKNLIQFERLQWELGSQKHKFCPQENFEIQVLAVWPSSVLGKDFTYPTLISISKCTQEWGVYIFV